ncbi:hypothetical protein PsYK624_147180 [Phanerochaete sordida]|uniref:Uncharacterized protein n=1 Tax=Phanerochaete sordida TaxID=48140 RepID=A0A9P3LKF9_9APHY|nr:hypothetical protein PsYK624_147180 [Phanerochaete sordida]
MSGGPIILTLTSWAEQRLQNVFTAKTEAAFDDAFDALVGTHATITVNGQKTSRAAYKKLLRSEEANETSGSVSFKGAVEVVKDTKALIPTGEVGVFFEATVHHKLLLFSNNITSSINLIVENVNTKPGEPEFDGRVATTIDQVYTDVPSIVERK